MRTRVLVRASRKPYCRAMRQVARLALTAYRILAIAIAVGLIVLNARLYHGPGATYTRPMLGADVVAELRGLRVQLKSGAGDAMQELFPEGFFFAHVLYGLSWVEVGLRAAPGEPLWLEALDEARWASARLDTPAGRAPFSADLVPTYGVFYLGWRSWLDGGIQLMQPDALRPVDERAAYEAELATLAAAFDAAPSPYLESYPGQAWPVDSVVAVAALRLHDKVAAPRYAATIARWLDQVRDLSTPDGGLLAHRTEPGTGRSLEGPRGTSQSLTARYLTEIDPGRGAAFYQLYRAKFVQPFLGVPGVVEAPGQAAWLADGDVDSGPLLFGFSASATMVALAAAQVNDDVAVRDALIPATEAVGLPLSLGGHKHYALGLLPIGDAFIVWAKTSSRWIPGDAAVTELPEIVDPGWRLPFHAVTVGLLALLGLPEYAARAVIRKHTARPVSTGQPNSRKSRIVTTRAVTNPDRSTPSVYKMGPHSGSV